MDTLLKTILAIYGIADATLLVFLYKQYRMLLKSDEYTSDSLINKFIVGFLAMGGMFMVVALFCITVYYIFG